MKQTLSMIGEEDLFNFAASEASTLVIRYQAQAKRRFDDYNKLYSFDRIVGSLSSGEWNCYLTRRAENEYQISIPMSDLDNGQLDLVVSYDPLKFSFEMVVNYNQKTRFKSVQVTPDPSFSIQMRARFAFLGRDDSWNDLPALMKMQEIKNRMQALDISPDMSIEMQRDIWDEYIEAQSQIIERLHQPYECIGIPVVTPEMSHNGKDIFRYRVEFQLSAENHGEYEQLRQSLKNDLAIDADFDSVGASLLRLDDIFRGLDPVIRKNYSDRYERDPKIGCILSIRPFTKAEIMQNKNSGRASFSQRGAAIYVRDCNMLMDELVAEMESVGYVPSGVGVEYRIEGVDNLYHSEHVEMHSLTFSSDGKFQKSNSEKELLLPEPQDGGRVFRIERKWDPEFKSGQAFMLNTLCHVYGKDNVHQSFFYRFNPLEKVEYIPGFTDEEWKDISKDLYMLGWSFTYGDTAGGKTVYFDFETKEEMEQIFAGIEKIGKFVIQKSPLDEDFNFKVVTHIIAKKTAQQLFKENIDKLNGADFVYELKTQNEDTGKTTTEWITVGKLNSFESSSEKLVLFLPNLFKEDQKVAQKFMKFYQKSLEMKSIHANLVGDKAKTTWLREAMEKLRATGSWEPNSRAVNDRIREFIFDSSKAEPVFRYENSTITDTEEFRTFDRTAVLRLNDSQKTAVLKGLAARDLCMLQGPPGTGKTTVIAELIWQHIRENQDSKLLLTSETNLAVDNALEKLMNGKAANPEMARYLTLIKPLRFGKSAKFEEEGKRYSIERIERWIDETAETSDEYDDEILSGEGLDLEEIEEGDVRDNVIQNWMMAIADRSGGDPRYRDVLKDWQVGLVSPDVMTKEYFRDLYFKHVNVVGSTCSSTGSPAFTDQYLAAFKHLSGKELEAVSKGLKRLKKSDNKDRVIEDLASVLGINENNIMDKRAAVGNACSVSFDTVIMDEASKATPPELLMPLCLGRKSIIIGDHRQLPPMLNERSFREALLDLGTGKAEALAEEIDRDFVDTSQFKRMILNPLVSSSIKATFNTQYRMHPDINDVISQFYENDECGGLHCGLERYDSNDLNDPQSRYHGLYQDGFINPSTHTIWVNVNAPESSDGSSKVNVMEIKAINRVLELLQSASGFKEYMDHWDTIASEVKRKEEKEIGVISFYGKQVRKIRESVRPRARQLGLSIKLNTVDKFQGMERNIVVVSTVRSSKTDKGNGRIEENRDAGFAKSPERLNVALSRARRLLIVVGNKDFFCQIRDKEGHYLYRKAIEAIEKSGRVIDYKDIANE